MTAGLAAWCLLAVVVGVVIGKWLAHRTRPRWVDVRDDLPAPIILGCLDCRGDLERWEEWYRCTRCSIYYHPDLLATTPAPIWYRIQEGRMICWECPPALPDMPRIHIDSAGDPIPCPVHGPAPER